MWLYIFKVLLFVGALHAAPVEKDGFGNENFLEKAVDKPKVHQGTAEIHTVSASKLQQPTHDAKELDTKLRQIFRRFLKQELSNDEVKIAKNGKAYEKKKLIPNQKYTEKKETSATSSDSHTNNNEEKHELSIKELENSVEHLLDSLKKRKESTKKDTSQKDENSKYKFEDYDEKKENNGNDGFEEFKEKLFNDFLDKKTQESLEKKREQTLIGTGKDPPHMIGTGKDNRKTRLNELYEELRTKTAAHVEQQKKNKRERFGMNDLVRLLNKLQKRKIFTFENGKFGLADHQDPLLVNTGKDHHKSGVDKSAESKLKIVESLINELGELDNRQKPVKKENTKYEESKKNMENIFLDTFKREMDKRKKMSGESERKDTHTVKKVSLRSRLLNLMDRLDQQIKDEEKRVVADENQISQLEQNNSSNSKRISSRRNSLENELDDILNGHRRSTRDDWGSDKETTKALQGFNVEQQNGKSSRP